MKLTESGDYDRHDRYEITSRVRKSIEANLADDMRVFEESNGEIQKVVFEELVDGIDDVDSIDHLENLLNLRRSQLE